VSCRHDVLQSTLVHWCSKAAWSCQVQISQTVLLKYYIRLAVCVCCCKVAVGVMKVKDLAVTSFLSHCDQQSAAHLTCLQLGGQLGSHHLLHIAPTLEACMQQPTTVGITTGWQLYTKAPAHQSTLQSRTQACTQSRTHAGTHARTQARTHAHTHARRHARRHARTHASSKRVKCVLQYAAAQPDLEQVYQTALSKRTTHIGTG
jgi:hypothetical protein